MSCMSNNSQKDSIVPQHSYSGPWLKQVTESTKTNIRLTYNPSKSFDSSNNMPYQHPFPKSELGPRPELRLLRVYYSALIGKSALPNDSTTPITQGTTMKPHKTREKNLSQTQSHSSLLILTDVISHFQRKNKRGNIRTCSLTNLQTINWAQHAQHTAPIPMSYKYQLNRSWKQNTSTIHHCTAFPNQAHLYSDFRLNQDKRNTTVTHQISKAESNLASPKNGSKAPTSLHPFIPHKHESNSVQHIIQRQISCQTSKSALSIQKRFSLTPNTIPPRRAIFFPKMPITQSIINHDTSR